ncbi:MAG TPA: 3-methyl-2-oxobutanoate dehydrogenase subunit VorB [Candidatus Bathyarchaeia archaeon]|nr:3-methyl-2-oxobutanoate dehydrogenase subunit VorB [Candidatus Bathyarchaeia archaeon]
MTERVLMKGNEAIAYGALGAGLNAYFAYPITPSTETPETLARELGNPKYPNFKVFLQAASELEAVNMTVGAGCTGDLAMTATASPGFSLKQEAISYASGMEVPFVVINVNRGGPGLGNLGVEQSDYFQSVKGGGHGGYRLIVLAPNSVQEMLSFPELAFDLAFKYRNPVLILADAFLGQLKEDVEPLTESNGHSYDTSWATLGSKNGQRHILNSLHLDLDAQEKHERYLHEKYGRMEKEVLFDHESTSDADVLLVSYGITSRICSRAVKLARDHGVKVGLLRPITLSPFPSDAIRGLAKDGVRFLVVELNAGQMIQDVRLAAGSGVRVEQYGRLGGNVPSANDIVSKCREMIDN